MLTCEGIDEMARYAGKHEEVKALTRKAMGGNMSFRECLKERLDILQPTAQLVNILVKYIRSKMETNSFRQGSNSRPSAWEADLMTTRP